MKKYALLLAVIAFLAIPAISTTVKKTAAKVKAATEKRHKITQTELKNKKLDLGFKQLYPDPDMDNLKLPGTINKYGADDECAKIIRVLRYENITRAVERKYNLPKNILLAMIMEESTGVDMLPNAHDDGGIGLIHMQPALATEFSLTTYKECDEMRCKTHGKKLRSIIEDNDYDRKKIIKYDDRFHPIENIDAAGRMLAYYMQYKPIKNLGPVRSAIKRYAGKWNYTKYWNHIVRNMACLESKEMALKIEKRFNALNQTFTINGRPANFEEYIRVSKLQNYNYGLEEYINGRKYNIANSDGGVGMYKQYVNPCLKQLNKDLCS